MAESWTVQWFAAADGARRRIARAIVATDLEIRVEPPVLRVPVASEVGSPAYVGVRRRHGRGAETRKRSDRARVDARIRRVDLARILGFVLSEPARAMDAVRLLL